MAVNGGGRGLGSGGAQDPDTLYCANHPNVPTYLRCGRCEKPICAKCRISTPVGFRCFQCANITVLPTYAVSTNYYMRSGLAAFGAATVIGGLWGLLPGYEFWGALLMGILVGEVTSAAANMKRGPGLQGLGLAAVAWGVVFSRLVFSLLISVQPDLLASIPGNLTTITGRLIRQGAGFLEVWQATDLTSLLFLLMAFGLTFFRLR